MPRKPNYSFERTQRQRAKTAKQEAKREAKAAANTTSTDGVAHGTPRELDQDHGDEVSARAEARG